MLVLTRRIGESFMIGEDVEVSVIKIMGDKVRFGIKAPTSVTVHRKEVWEAIRSENVAAAKAPVTDLGALADALVTREPQKAVEDEDSPE